MNDSLASLRKEIEDLKQLNRNLAEVTSKAMDAQMRSEKELNQDLDKVRDVVNELVADLVAIANYAGDRITEYEIPLKTRVLFTHINWAAEDAIKRATACEALHREGSHGPTT